MEPIVICELIYFCRMFPSIDSFIQELLNELNTLLTYEATTTIILCRKGKSIRYRIIFFYNSVLIMYSDVIFMETCCSLIISTVFQLHVAYIWCNVCGPVVPVLMCLKTATFECCSYIKLMRYARQVVSLN